MAERIKYEIDLSGFAVRADTGTEIRTITRDDADALAVLMLDAYRDTIDFTPGNDLDDARAEVAGHFDRSPLSAFSLAIESSGRLSTSVLVELVDGDAFVGYVMTRPEVKGQGLARRVVAESLSRLANAGYQRVVFFITAGNEPSERLFIGFGAEPSD